MAKARASALRLVRKVLYGCSACGHQASVIEDFYKTWRNHIKKTDIELFVGAGGLALGISDAGFKHEGVIE
ncbi:MAG: hypothetical protein DDT32_01529 [Syntrophomonadaceae bacterium]|nr:hypothetical protein [Bacillota bacterium]